MPHAPPGTAHAPSPAARAVSPGWAGLADNPENYTHPSILMTLSLTHKTHKTHVLQ